ncbi:MAG: 50S ribosomal protein L11 methyltransferase [Candidatus Latescibacteria bacterium]|nr:50S ribosomal protein L11 methyltransferase [Candidatus Latescibacterota bacterium]
MFSYSHYPMLKDHIRMEAFRQAIFQRVAPGDIVVDLGAGTCILAFWALQAGAQKVFAVEQTSILRTARQIARQNHLDGRICFIRGDSRDVQLPEQADLMVCEMLGSFGIEEDILPLSFDARRRFLKRGARLIPQVLTLFIVPVEAPETYDSISFWEDVYGFDYRPMKAYLTNSTWVEAFSPRALLSDPQELKRIDLRTNSETQLKASIECRIQRRGVLHGFCGFFSAQLAPGILLSNSPLGAPTHWNQRFFPSPEPAELRQGDKVLIDLSTSRVKGLLHFNWTIRICSDGRVTRLPGLSTFLGMLDSTEDLRDFSVSPGAGAHS